MIKDKDILSLEDFLSKYRKNLKRNNISKKIKENMIATILDIEYMKIANYKRKIEAIYTSIKYIKYVDYPKDPGFAYTLIQNIIYLKMDPDFEKYNRVELCNNAYKELYELDNNLFKDYYLKKEMDEDFLPEHLLDIKYHINNFLKYGEKDEYFVNEIKNELWRSL